MGFFDRLFGRDDRAQAAPPQGRFAPQPSYHETALRQGQAYAPAAAGNAHADARTADEIAIERYRYLLRTAPPERIEQAHEEAFAQLTPQQRQLLFAQLARESAPGEAPVSDDPQTLARAATRQELRRPGSMEHTLANTPSGQQAPGQQGQPGGGPGFGSMLGASLLGTVGGYVIGSAIMAPLLGAMGGFGAGEGDAAASADGAEAAQSGEATPADEFGGPGAEAGGLDGGGFDDFGGGFGDFGGSFDF